MVKICEEERWIRFGGKETKKKLTFQRSGHERSLFMWEFVRVRPCFYSYIFTCQYLFCHIASCKQTMSLACLTLISRLDCTISISSKRNQSEQARRRPNSLWMKERNDTEKRRTLVQEPPYYGGRRASTERNQHCRLFFPTQSSGCGTAEHEGIGNHMVD